MLQHAAPLPAETLPLSQTLGRVLEEEVTAKEPLPPYPASIKVRCSGRDASTSQIVPSLVLSGTLPGAGSNLHTLFGG